MSMNNEEVKKQENSKNNIEETVYDRPRYRSPYERTRAQVYATGNKWAIENFHATHN